MTWSRSASGSPDEVRHQARKWVNGASGIEAVQVATAEQVVDQISKQFADLVQYVQLPPPVGKVELPVKRSQLHVTASGEFEKDKGGSVTVNYTVEVPQRDAKFSVAANGKTVDADIVERFGAGVGP